MSDTLTDGDGNVLTLSNGPTFSGSTQFSGEGTLKVDEIATYTAFYIVTQSEIDTGKIINSANVTASSPGQSNNVSDTSDNGNDVDGNTVDDPTIVMMTLNPLLETTKTANVLDTNSSGVIDLGDNIVFTITVENKGNVTLTGLNLVDTLTDGNGNALSLTSTPSYVSSTATSSIGTLKVGEVESYTATFTITQAAVDSGSIINSVNATASSPGNTNDVSDISDDGNDSDGNTSNDNTIVNIPTNSSIEVTKTAVVNDVNSNSSNDQGDIITYTITVENKGNVTLSNLTLVDTLADNDGNALSL